MRILFQLCVFLYYILNEILKLALMYFVSFFFVNSQSKRSPFSFAKDIEKCACRTDFSYLFSSFSWLNRDSKHRELTYSVLSVLLHFIQ